MGAGPGRHGLQCCVNNSAKGWGAYYSAGSQEDCDGQWLAKAVKDSPVLRTSHPSDMSIH